MFNWLLQSARINERAAQEKLLTRFAPVGPPSGTYRDVLLDTLGLLYYDSSSETWAGDHSLDPGDRLAEPNIHYWPICIEFVVYIVNIVLRRRIKLVGN